MKGTLARSLCVAAAVVSGAASQGQAWGVDGHRIIGEIAYRQLAPAPRREVRRLLPGTGRYRTLYEATTWADTFARKHEAYDYLKPWHFINADPEAGSVDVAADCGGQGCVLSAIVESACLLKSGSGSSEKRLEALFLLAHFVGDAHQPLHVAHPDGRGGNRTSVDFFGERVDLHALWDAGMIRRRLRNFEHWKRGEGEGGPGDQYESWEIYAGELSATLPAGADTWKRELDPVEWANESLRVARKYTFGLTDSQSLAKPYYDEAMPVLERRLQQAGVRLAGLLDAVFSGDVDLGYVCASDASG